MVLYLCDPDKNTVCKKSFCAHLYSDGECMATTKPECAQLDKDGKPIPYAFVGADLAVEKTVGQYTGLKDKNGNKIFEGDIVRWKACDHWAPDDGIVSGYVLYDDGQWFIQRPNIRSYLWLAHLLCEVIGNIHDNPELIGGDGDSDG